MVKKNIIGRERELKTLQSIEKSKEAEFLAVYGRRRVGKTFLIREYFSASKAKYIEVMGIKDASYNQQLQNFTQALSNIFLEGAPIKTPINWQEAFDLFTTRLNLMPKSQKIVLFLDELPWMATPKSKLIQMLGHYWNSHWSRFPNFVLIVCGSAASWMLENLIFARGGLHNRLTKKIQLEPFNLRETKKFLISRGIKLNNKHILDIYMAIGGVPFYLKEVAKGKSATQVIDDICFNKSGLLNKEFNNLFHSLFDQAELHLKIIQEIAKAKNSISRSNLLIALKKESGGTLKKRLEELEASGFIKSYIPYGKTKRDHYFRLIDEYTLFYLQWIKPFVSSGITLGQGYWEKMTKNPNRNTWAGYAFESLCLKHIPEILKALKLEKVSLYTGKWIYLPSKKSNEKGAQIDLLIDRIDDVITICEIKYSENKYLIDKSYSQNLYNKMDVFKKQSKISKQLFISMITTRGIKKNCWSEDIVQSEITLDDLF